MKEKFKDTQRMINQNPWIVGQTIQLLSEDQKTNIDSPSVACGLQYNLTLESGEIS